MAAGAEYGVFLFGRLAAGSVFVSVFGLVAYSVGGYLFFVESIELAYPFLDLDRDPILNLFITLVGIGLFITSVPFLLLATLFSREGIDVLQVVMTTALGALGLALAQLSIWKIV